MYATSAKSRLKSHTKMKKTADFLSAVFNLTRKLHTKNRAFFSFYFRGFCYGLNESAPFIFLLLDS